MVHKKRTRGPGKKRELVMEDILNGATRLLEEQGGDLVALTLADLARRLGYATSALYRYFDSKEALVVALQGRAAISFAADLERALAEHAGRALARQDRAGRALEAVAVAALAYAGLRRRAPSSFRLIALSLGDPAAVIADDLAQPVAVALKLLLARVGALLDEASRAGALGRAEPGREAVLFAALHGALLLDKLARLDLPLLAAERLVAQTLRVALVGMGAAPRAAGRAVEQAERSVGLTFASPQGG